MSSRTPSRFLHHVVVPVADDLVAVRLDDPSALLIRFDRFGVLAPIQLDDESGGATGEVGDLAANLKLGRKPASVQLTATQPRPQQCLGVRFLAPKPLCHPCQPFAHLNPLPFVLLRHRFR